MKNLSKNIQSRLSKLGMTQDMLAKKTNLSQVMIHKLLSGESKSTSKILDLARALECDPYWLAEGDSFSSTDTRQNTTPGPSIKSLIPIISWVQAGDWSEIIDNFQPGNADEYLPCPVSCSPETFALRVRGESMFPDYKNNDIIFVDPKQNAENGDDVVVRLDNDAESTFKRLVIEGSKRYLKAVNAAWPTPIIEVNDEATICGVVIFSGTIRK